MITRREFVEGALNEAACAAYGHVERLEYDGDREVVTIRYKGGTWWHVRVAHDSNGMVALDVFTALSENRWED